MRGAPASVRGAEGVRAGGAARRSLYDNQLEGSLPGAWGQRGGFANVTALYLDTNRLSGALPPQWGANKTSWPQLSLL